MRDDRIEASWIDVFEKTLAMCGVKEGTVTAILSETQSRQVNVQLAELALLRLGAAAFHVVMPTRALPYHIPIRSTGSSPVMHGNPAALTALASSELIVDLTVEGTLNSPDRPTMLAQGARHFYISDEHPDVLERCAPEAWWEPYIRLAGSKLREAKSMHVTSAAGTDLKIDLQDARTVESPGFITEPGKNDSWPGGLVACFPNRNTVNGVLVLDRGDLNLTFKRYLRDPVTLVLEDDYVKEIIGDNPDAEMLRNYMADWGQPDAYATSHVGWGLNPKARWDSAMMYNKRDLNGVEQRVFSGNFLYSTGSNYGAGRLSHCHFDLPVRSCTISLDDEVVVDRGLVVGFNPKSIS